MHALMQLRKPGIMFPVILHVYPHHRPITGKNTNELLLHCCQNIASLLRVTSTWYGTFKPILLSGRLSTLGLMHMINDMASVFIIMYRVVRYDNTPHVTVDWTESVESSRSPSASCLPQPSLSAARRDRWASGCSRGRVFDGAGCWNDRVTVKRSPPLVWLNLSSCPAGELRLAKRNDDQEQQIFARRPHDGRPRPTSYLRSVIRRGDVARGVDRRWHVLCRARDLIMRN